MVFSVITGLILIFCCFLHIKDLCVRNTNQIKEEALQFQLSDDSSNVTHMAANNWESRPSIQIQPGNMKDQTNLTGKYMLFESQIISHNAMIITDKTLENVFLVQ